MRKPLSEQEIHQVQARIAGLPPCTGDVAFSGGTFRLRGPSLGPLLGYLAARNPPADLSPLDGMSPEHKMLAAAHLFLEQVTVPDDWPRLQVAALAGRAGQDEVQALVRAVIEQHTAWPFWPAVRLLSFLAGNLAERDGDLLRTGGGLGLAAMTPRQACNATFALLLSGQRTEEDRDQFLDDLYYDGDAEAEALAMVRQMQAAQAAQAQEAPDG